MTTASIVVCSLDDMESLVADQSASHLISLINKHMMPKTPISIERVNHLKLAMNDIETAVHGSITPSHVHIERLLQFVRDWDRAKPLVIHCWAGVSRSTAAAFITLCTLNPHISETELADLMRQKSPTATPNNLLISYADQQLERSGRMLRAIETIGRGSVSARVQPFSLQAIVGDEG